MADFFRFLFWLSIYSQSKMQNYVYFYSSLSFKKLRKH